MQVQVSAVFNTIGDVMFDLARPLIADFDYAMTKHLSSNASNLRYLR
jgi:hypothetical protein